MTLLYLHDKYEYIYVKFHFRGSMYCLQCTLHWENVTLKFENSNKKKILYVECVNQSVYIVIQKIMDHVNLLYIKIVKTDVRCVGQLL